MSLDRPAVTPVRVDYQTADGTATAGSDYTATHGTVEFGPGETTQTVDAPPTTVPSTTSPGTTVLPVVVPVVDPGVPPTTVPDPSQTSISKTIDVPVRADTSAEGAETFTVKLTLLTPASATMADDTGLGTITDPESGPTPPPVVSVANAADVTEPGPGATATARFPVRLSSVASGPVTVRYATRRESVGARRRLHRDLGHGHHPRRPAVHRGAGQRAG